MRLYLMTRALRDSGVVRKSVWDLSFLPLPSLSSFSLPLLLEVGPILRLWGPLKLPSGSGRFLVHFKH